MTEKVRGGKGEDSVFWAKEKRRIEKQAGRKRPSLGDRGPHRRMKLVEKISVEKLSIQSKEGRVSKKESKTTKEKPPPVADYQEKESYVRGC